ncbi:ATP-binding cassette domain-containing protein [Campylobacter sp. MIT 21-1685]|uniref:ATP-binding cassette domain-containing protein n=1 Tax=unclassified Campylobacter TaxID=2593542 RepID=UPI00224B71CF|nr:MULTISPECIES: ATP-binding cassette domain-containing protein [unclassified Campylobacter]MCX2682672.1 ATP-binding cassette domain-containing protein [Campylobacter sp. MIT 21-1684]MCX2750952.1 ATP-binding cassette domain-containing protein [Campylobacter sp. MIT 21-1682]MCX2807115.1 ATP-binding cassette domain-containing protein [Campylobacter sp. MIT 21-1685]
MKIQNLSLSFRGTTLLEKISFSVKKGEVVALLGESGSGKSLLLKALARLLNSNFHLRADTFCVEEKKVLELSKSQLRVLRSELALILQDAQLSLYPYLDVGALFHLLLKTHTNLNTKERKRKAFECLESLGFAELELLWHSYVFELSVGMARRVSLALALVCEPKFLLCDEITSSLDEENTKKIVQILKNIKANKACIFATHDLKIAKELSDRVLVLQQGTILHNMNTCDFFQQDTFYSRLYKELYVRSE